MIILKAMNHEDFQEYVVSSMETYAKEKVASGNWSKDESIDLAKKDYKRLLPQGEKSEFNYLFTVFHEEVKVGVIWIAQKSPENQKEGFIYEIKIYDEYQGLGYGKQAMIEIEIIAREELGMNKLGLHVFGHNKIARGLYEKLGYETTNVVMAKTI